MKKVFIIVNSIGTALAMIFFFGFLKVMPQAIKGVQGTLNSYSTEQVAQAVTLLGGLLITCLIIIIFLVLSIIISLIVTLTKRNAEKKVIESNLQVEDGKTIEENIEKEN